ncbi:hypothetical protein BN874_210013 [Candidatus Contendobacter odensis Run_B_J11]|uniref:Uncharacterized protein n=1 Tax=Candidatus Contendobacter odensis Run_B_J11 TaxID=1400861 RepID=A0A7U7GBC1_9GAMM|nr:hypothetical protein BN874_210013 [Candidatus Contendobacter odensis Run_B_J11]
MLEEVFLFPDPQWTAQAVLIEERMGAVANGGSAIESHYLG